MSLDNLSAQELARIDAICLDYESKLREGIDVSLSGLVDRYGGRHAELLRSELKAIHEEVQQEMNPPEIIVPFQTKPPQPIDPSELADSLESTTPKPIQDEIQTMSVDEAPTPPVSPPPIVPPNSPSPPPVSSKASKSADRPSKIKSAQGKAKLPKIGDQIGPYSLRGTLGRGGMGVVYKAIDTRLNRDVAIKFLDATTHHQELNDRFEREAKAVAALNHRNIVALFDVGVSNGLPYAVMELLQGQTLHQRLAESRMRTSDVREIGAQIASALAAAHQKDVIHRDLKPQNVMLLGQKGEPDRSTDSKVSRFEVAANRSQRINSELMQVKVFDFGLSRIETQNLGQRDLQTRDGVILGTPGFMSPEQARGEAATSAADMFSLGCILFEGFYGKPAIVGDTTAERFAATIAKTPEPDPVRRRDDVELADLIQECLSPNPADRPASAAEVADRLRNLAPADPLMGKMSEGFSAGKFVRRHFVTLVGGGFLGSVVGGFSMSPAVNELRDIRRLAVLSFHDGGFADAGKQLKSQFGLPLENRTLGQGEMLSSALVHELSQLDVITVLPFRSMSVVERQDIIDLGKRWEVDAFITGTAIPKTVANTEYLLLDVQIISATTGEQLHSFVQRRVNRGSLRESSELARDVADKIQLSLMPTRRSDAMLKSEPYRCLIDGKVRVDPDSVKGLKHSLMCLMKAAMDDALYAEPVAGIALASMLLAIQSDSKEETGKYVQDSLESFEQALNIDPKSVDARLAKAMHAWQVLGDFDEAEMLFDELKFANENNWQVRHQYGLLMLAMGRTASAIDSLRRANRLNPTSMMVRLDKARAHWYSGNVEAAIRDTKQELLKPNGDNKMAHGLLIDLYEQQEKWQEAAMHDEGFDLTKSTNRDAYFEFRKSRLSEVPYVPFGGILNSAILEARTRKFDESRLAELAVPTSPPMFPLLLSAHPAFKVARTFDQARDELLYKPS